MKITLKSLIYSFLLICLCTAANAQSVVDTLRVGVGIEGLATSAPFGTTLNTTVDGLNAYKYGAGVSVRVDVPLIEHFNLSGSVGYNTYFKSSNSNISTAYISGTNLPNFQTIPLKVGIKWFIGKVLYMQAEVGETIFANKTAMYGLYGNAVTWSPQFGLLIPMKKSHTFLDAGVRYENFQSFYNDGLNNKFWGLHFAYMFNL